MAHKTNRTLTSTLLTYSSLSHLNFPFSTFLYYFILCSSMDSQQKVLQFIFRVHLVKQGPPPTTQQNRQTAMVCHTMLVYSRLKPPKGPLTANLQHKQLLAHQMMQEHFCGQCLPACFILVRVGFIFVEIHCVSWQSTFFCANPKLASVSKFSKFTDLFCTLQTWRGAACLSGRSVSNKATKVLGTKRARRTQVDHMTDHHKQPQSHCFAHQQTKCKARKKKYAEINVPLNGLVTRRSAAPAQWQHLSSIACGAPACSSCSSQQQVRLHGSCRRGTAATEGCSEEQAQ
eukprot:TRINITY_DN66937_c3_g1_i1.p1 TRINITY_DN66937_c3_g1~~TRINITY_DN66937_c3_g1_i1.p1  ORF type:complete len:288 (-),score=-6.49 TRINITY_DN66937_c3_g1_i1:150-1013(-)